MCSLFTVATLISAVITTGAATHPQAQRRLHTEHRKSVLDAMSYPEQLLLSAVGKSKHFHLISFLESVIKSISQILH